MTTEAYPGPEEYTVSGTGPYAINHEFTQNAVAPFVVIEGVETALDSDDFSLSAESGDSGNLTLSAGAATTHDGRTLRIYRETPIEQGWSGGNSRERGVEVQMDRTVQSVQEALYWSRRSLRTTTAHRPLDLSGKDDVTLLWKDNRFQSGPAASDIASAQAFAAAAAVARDKAEQWAEEDEDVEVETDQYSAKHWARKAEAAPALLTIASLRNLIQSMTANGTLGASDEFTVLDADDLDTPKRVTLATLQNTILAALDLEELIDAQDAETSLGVSDKFVFRDASEGAARSVNFAALRDALMTSTNLKSIINGLTAETVLGVSDRFTFLDASDSSDPKTVNFLSLKNAILSDAYMKAFIDGQTLESSFGVSDVLLFLDASNGSVTRKANFLTLINSVMTAANAKILIDTLTQVSELGAADKMIVQDQSDSGATRYVNILDLHRSIEGISTSFRGNDNGRYFNIRSGHDYVHALASDADGRTVQVKQARVGSDDTAVVDDARPLRLFMGYGESHMQDLTTNMEDGTVVPPFKGQPYPNHILTTSGERFFDTTVSTGAELTGLEPLDDGDLIANKQCPINLIAIATEYLERRYGAMNLEGTPGTVCFRVAEGGEATVAFEEATNAYDNVITAAGAIQTLASGYGRDLEVDAVWAFQGTNGVNGVDETDNNLFASKWAAIKTAMIADLKTETGQSGDPLWFMFQVGNKDSGILGSAEGIPEEQRSLAQSDSNVILFTNMACYPEKDNVHLGRPGKMMTADAASVAYRTVKLGGTFQAPGFTVTASRSGDTVTVTVNSTSIRLTGDDDIELVQIEEVPTSEMPAIAQKGFRFFYNGVEQTIDTVSVGTESGGNGEGLEFTLTLASDPGSAGTEIVSLGRSEELNDGDNWSGSRHPFYLDTGVKSVWRNWFGYQDVPDTIRIPLLSFEETL
ncbi:hypothetical protein [Roseovarius indicus]|uniref:Uncharacterized protein n=1 Tax=Roseovarius indicus TaxID=540747 RepID=A0A0T5P3E3_9RHOB|nr:hypothetical protein [Roseovarius indicus]KRS15665.1 hypothetical protein XM52_22775 [Roseovarius indicus]QEW27823.1 hypothetical protein RIdsm_03643 [Roseovarius indicus]SFE79842.1 hypothetical protein SAMN04488031_12245 [Roseovarius indicus]